MALKTLRPRLATISTKAVNDTHQPKSRWGHGRGGRPWRRKRDEIFKRDKYTCQVCDRVGGELELDHILNVARGGIVDSQALADAINNEQILGYGSDVFEQEPIAANDPLLALGEHPRVIFSPHNAWGSKSAQETLWQMLSKQVSDFINQAQ